VDIPDTAAGDLFDETGTIIADRACRRCGYNVRGLRAEGLCPECGTPIGLSTHGDLLRYADPAWVEKLRLGIKYMLWGIVVSIVVGFLASCLARAAGRGKEVQQAIGLLAGLLGVYGAWLLTSPDPSRIGEDRYITARKIVRFGLIVGLLNQCLMIAIYGIPGITRVVVLFLVIPAVLCGLLGVAAEFAKFLYLEKLADRVPDPKLAGFARFLRWAYSIGLAAMIVFGGVWLIGLVTAGGSLATLAVVPTATAPGGGPPGTAPPTGPSTSPAGTVPFGGVSPGLGTVLLGGACIFGVATLVFGIMVIVLYVRFARRFREQSEIARATWATAIPAGQAPPPPGEQIG
jgi:hypothetical protein